MRRFAIPLILLVLLVGYLATGVTLVRPGERAVVRRFGRVLDTKPAPGLWLGLPWGMERVDRVAVHQVRHVVVGYRPPADGEVAEPASAVPGQFVTGDHNLVNVQIAIDYAVEADEEAIVNYVLQEDRIEGLVARAAETALAEWLASGKIDDILIRGRAQLPEWLSHETQRRIADYRLGVRVQRASVPYLEPPEEVREAFNQVNQAYNNIETQRRIAQTLAARQFAGAEAEKYRLEQDARAYSREQELSARADADAFLKRLEQYQKAPSRGDFLARLWWDEMGRLFTRMKLNGQLDLLDNHLGADGLDITHAPPLPRKR
jgi:membrane protease subunit HflK